MIDREAHRQRLAAIKAAEDRLKKANDSLAKWLDEEPTRKRSVLPPPPEPVWRAPRIK